jgi:hypothetical protein
MTHELRDQLQALANEHDRTLSQFCMLVLRDYARDQAKKKPGES